MKSRDLVTLGLAAASVAVGLDSGGSLAFEAKQAETTLGLREFFKPDLYISGSNVKLEEAQGLVENLSSWDSFFATHGDGFEVYLDPRSGAPSNVIGHVPLIPGDGFGNHLTLGDVSGLLGRPLEKVDARAVADAVTRFVILNQEAFRVDPRELGAPRAVQVHEDLWQVSIPQQVDGIPVRYGRLAASIGHGNLVLFGTEVWGRVRTRTVPSIAAEHALKVGLDFAGGRHDDALWMEPRLELIPFAPAELQAGEAYAGPLGQGYGHRLAWVFGFTREREAGSWEVIVDAQTGEVLAFQDVNQYSKRKIMGGVYPQSSTEVCVPGGPPCGTMQSDTPMPFADTGLPFPDSLTNSGGLFEWSGPQPTTTLQGPLVSIFDNCGPFGASGGGGGDLNLGGVNGDHDCGPGGPGSGNTPSARTGFYEINKLKEQALGWLPANAWLAGQLQVELNLTGLCNAFYSPSPPQDINFYQSRSACRNSGEIAGILDHEWGHGLDHHDANGTLSNSSETYADIAAIYRQQQSCPGYGFNRVNQGCGMTSDGTGFNEDAAQTGPSLCELDCSARGADWNNRATPTPSTPANFSCTRCSSGPGPCGRQVHCDSIPGTEAAWDLVARDLQMAPFNFDATTAFMIGNRLFYQGSGNIGSWWGCTCPSSSSGCGATNAYMQWLTADDDNGNLMDGTPHMTAIFNAFDRHAIACAAPAAVNSGCAGTRMNAPTLTAVPGNEQVVLSWSAVPGAVRYWVLRSEGSAGCDHGKTRIATVNGTSYTDTAVGHDRPYYYNVVAAGATDACFGRVSACKSATPLSCEGKVFLDRSAHSCNDTLGITLLDADLVGTLAATVLVFSGTEMAPTAVTLSENPASSGRFTGQFFTGPPPPNPADGWVSVVDGDTITVRYVDNNYCGIAPVPVDTTALADCAGPVITNVWVANLTRNAAEIRWDTNEASDSEVTYEDVVPPTANTRFVPGLGTTHSVSLAGLAPCTPYYYEVKSVDSLGNATTDDNGGLYYSFITGRETQYSYGGPPQAIPDFTPGSSSFTGAYATITIPDDRPVSDVDVTVGSITHPFAGEIAIYLIAPDATEILLASFRGGASPGGYANTVFDDAASTPIGSGTPPFSGTFRPEVPLSALNSLSTKGHWTLRVVDAVPMNTGTLHSWSLTFSHPSLVCGPGPLAVAGVAWADACNGTGGAGGDGNVDPGEDVVVQVTARNDGTEAVSNVSATLSTGSSFVTITNPNADYPDISAGGLATPTPASFHVDAAAPCGSMLDFSVQFSSSQGSWVRNFQIPVGLRVFLTTMHSGPGTPIPDPGPPPATSIINVADPDNVLDVNVHLDVQHTADANLDIFLTGPNGISVELSTDNGSQDDDYQGSVFDDDALVPITSGPVPFTGSFRPETPLSALNGIPAMGLWTLEVTDDTPSDFGSLTGWSLEVTTQPALPCSVCTVVLPGEATNLRWAAGGKSTLSWNAAPNATSHSVYRGLGTSLPDLLTSAIDSCKVASSFTLTTGPILNEQAVAGRLFWYLVRGSNTVGEGTAGAATSGQRTHNSSGVCP